MSAVEQSVAIQTLWYATCVCKVWQGLVLWASIWSHLNSSKLREIGPKRLCMSLPGNAQYHQLAASKAFVAASLFPSICPIGHAVGRGCAVR